MRTLLIVMTLGLIGLYVLDEQSAPIVEPTVKAKIVPRKTKTTPQSVMLPTNEEARASRAPSQSEPVKINITKKGREVQEVTKKSHPALPEGLALASETFAVKREEYSEGMGELIEERAGLLIIRSGQRPLVSAANVAVDESGKRFYPISAVVKIENINEERRQELLALGLSEHFYQPDLKVMFVQSSHDEVLDLGESLKASKLEASLEIIRAFHRTR